MIFFDWNVPRYYCDVFALCVTLANYNLCTFIQHNTTFQWILHSIVSKKKNLNLFLTKPHRREYSSRMGCNAFSKYQCIVLWQLKFYTPKNFMNRSSTIEHNRIFTFCIYYLFTTKKKLHTHNSLTRRCFILSFLRLLQFKWKN